MTVLPGSDGHNRFVFVLGSGVYTADPTLAPLPGVSEDLGRVKALFGSLGYAEILPELAHAPDAQQVRIGLEAWLRAEERCEKDVLVVYYAGHGLRGSRQHRLTCLNSRQDLVATALATRDLAELLADTRVGHVLLLLDTCFAELVARLGSLAG